MCVIRTWNAIFETLTLMDRLTVLLAYYEEDPGDAFTRFAIASEYLKLGNTERALAFFEGLVADIPGYVGTYYHLGMLYERLGRTEDAIRTFRSGIRQATEQRDLHARAELQDALLRLEGIDFD